jgi:hypothetical protein
MVRTENTRRASRAARRQHGATQATQHGWAHSALPLTATVAERLLAKVADDVRGDRAADALQALGARQ